MTAFVFGIGEGLNLPVGQLAHGTLVGKIFGCPAPEAALPTSLPTKQVSTQRLSPFFSGHKKARNPWRIAGFRFLSAFAGYDFGSSGGTRTPDRVVNSHLLYRLSYRGMKENNLWLGDRDSNPDKRSQSPLSCR